MPYTILTKDGIRIDNIPDNIPKDDQSLKDAVAQMRASGEKSRVLQIEPVETQTEPQNFFEGAAQGLKEGTASTIRGLAGGVASTVGLVSDPITALINIALPEEYQGKPAAEAVQELLTRLGVPESETQAQKIVQAGAAGLAGAGGSVLTGQALAKGASLVPSAIQKVGTAIAAQPAQQLAGGIGSGVASQAAESAGANPLVTAGAGLAGGLVGSGVGALGDFTPQSQLAKTIQSAESAGQKVMTSDVFEPRTGAQKFGQSFSEKIPVFGTGGMRKTQQAKRIASVRNLALEYNADDLAAASDDVMQDLLANRKADISKWTAMKDEVVDSVKSAPVLKESTSKGIAASVPVDNAIKKIDEQLAKMKATGLDEMSSVISKLENWKTAIQGKDISVLRDIQKQMGESFADQNLGSVRSLGEKAVSAIYGKIDDNGVPIDGMAKDMFDYIRKTGGTTAANKWVVANKKLSGMMDELQTTALKYALDKGEMTPEAIDRILFSRNKSDIETLMRNLTPDGRARAQDAVIAKIAHNKEGDIDVNRFIKGTKALGGKTGIYFGEEAEGRIKGLARALELTTRASQAALTPPTGVQTLIPASYTAMAALIPGTPMERFIGATAGMAIAGGAARLYESKPVRDYLVKLAATKEGSQAEIETMKRLLETMRAQENRTKERTE